MPTRNHKLTGKRILIIDPDLSLLRLHSSAFAQAGCQVYTSTDGQTGLDQFYLHQPDLVLLDLQLPSRDGWEVCASIRQFSNVPIIILTQLNGSDNVIRGLNQDADDYLVKPIEVNELIARAGTRLRRTALPAVSNASHFYSDGYLTLDLNKRSVRVRGEPVHLTKTEFDLLAYLFLHTGQVLPHQQILERVWEGKEDHPINVVHLYIRRLREKLGDNSKPSRYLLTEYGLGYRFKK